ncbi:DNA-binding transcriptional LysR family regulator [Bradyrhizobium sp. USDA 3315]
MLPLVCSVQWYPSSVRGTGCRYSTLDRLLTLVGADRGLLLALEGATGAAYQGVTFREVHDAEGPTRLSFRAYWRQDNCNPSLRPFLDLLRERYPDLSAAPETG